MNKLEETLIEYIEENYPAWKKTKGGYLRPLLSEIIMIAVRFELQRRKGVKLHTAASLGVNRNTLRTYTDGKPFESLLGRLK